MVSSLKYLYIDFEYNRPQEMFPHMVCVAYKTSDGDENKLWLQKSRANYLILKQLLSMYNKKGYIFIAYAATAEARCLMELSLDPTEFKWIDLYLEGRQIRNGKDKYNYGTYFVNNFKMKSRIPSRNPAMNAGENNTKLFYGLTDCCARLLNVNIDKYLKTSMRDLILEDKDEYSDEEKSDILTYCESDIQYLPQLHEKMTNILMTSLNWSREKVESAQLIRGEFAAHVAVMETEGIPVHRESLVNLRKNVNLAKDRLISDLVENYYPFFERAKKRKRDLIGTWRDTYKNFEKFIVEHPEIDEKKWKLTDSGRYCADDEYLKSREGIPEIKQYREVRKILGQLKWLRQPKENEEDLFDSIGSDDRMRTFFGIYGTQTARNAPKAKKFILAMSAWLRCMIRPPKGYVLTEIDYASQEFAIAAILSKDKSMIEAYISGDPYLYFAKKAGAVPKDGTKSEYKVERDLFKATTLGLQYGMGYKALALKLSSDTGKHVSESEAMKLIDLHKRVYPVYWRWLERLDNKYIRRKYLVLPCGWVLFGDNPNVLSVRNFPTQGSGSSVIREAVRQCKEKDVKVVATLHDSVYILSKEKEVKKDVQNASKCLINSFNEILKNETSLDIRLDVISHSWKEPWVSEKGARFYDILKEYLVEQETVEDLDKRLLETVYS